jgi:hypothetical protein
MSKPPAEPRVFGCEAIGYGNTVREHAGLSLCVIILQQCEPMDDAFSNVPELTFIR